MSLRLPDFSDVIRARETIAPYLKPTPLYNYNSLGALVGGPVWIKHENHNPTCAFKVRGGVNFMAHLSPDLRKLGVVTASTGNHGQSVAFAGSVFGARVVVAMPNGANAVKVDGIRDLGGEVRFVGSCFDDCRAYVEEIGARGEMYYLSSGDEPLLIAGVATHTVEIIEALPDVDVIVVPVGSGSGAAGACIAARAMNPTIKVIGVQSEAAPSAYLSWKEARRVEAPARTFAEGLATAAPFELPQAILRRDLDDFILVGEAEIRSAMRLIIEKTRNLVEAAGAAPLAAALKIRDRIRGKRTALIVSGGNATMASLAEVLA